MNTLLPEWIEPHVALAPFTSWQVGGPAEFLARPKDIPELQAAIQWARGQGCRATILSGGTNVLVSDRGIKGLVIALGKMSGMSTREKDGRLEIECLAGTGKSDLLKAFLKAKLEPALFLAGLPGDVGGGVAMNAGVGEMIVPREFVEITDWIEVMRFDQAKKDFVIVRLAKDDLKWSYRHCEGWKPGIIVRAGISWPLEPKPDVLERVKKANQVRLSKQPLDLPSCGSVFVNPPAEKSGGRKSGQLIEGAGLKGFTIGGAQVSTKHANFIVNIGDATASDIDGVIRHVQATVRQTTGVELTTEVVYLGEWTR